MKYGAGHSALKTLLLQFHKQLVNNALILTALIVKIFFCVSDASSIVDHTLMFSALVRGIRVYPWAWRNWICLRLELYGFYMSSELCASAWPIETIKPCVGDRDCGQNAECRRLQASAIRKQGKKGYNCVFFTL